MSKALALMNVDSIGAHLLASVGLDELGQAVARRVTPAGAGSAAEDEWACENCHSGNPHRLKRCTDCGTSRY
jgi:hypothetical protein